MECAPFFKQIICQFFNVVLLIATFAFFYNQQIIEAKLPKMHKNLDQK